jgi:hypothetical protein
MLPNQIITAISAETPQSIRAYFEKVRVLAKSGNPYPVKLDEVWPLCYAEKGIAVKVLKKQFIEGYDFRSFDQKVKRGVGGTVTQVYELSVPCMEFFIARKVRAVFEIYREVFHRVADMVEQSFNDKMEALVKLNNSLTKRVIGLESIVSRMDKAQTIYFEAKVKAETKKHDQDVLIRRTRIFSMVNMKIRCSHGSLKWPDFWDSFRKSYGIDVAILQREQSENLLDVAIRHGYIDKIEDMLDAQ